MLSPNALPDWMLTFYHARPPCGRPRFARAFHKLRRYHTRPLRLNWGPENVHFAKRHFWDLNINVRRNFFMF